MMSTPIADMVKQMLAAGVPDDMIVLAVATAERAAAAAQSTAMSTMSTGGQVDTRQEKRRLSERLKKAKWRAKRKNSPPASADHPVDVSTVPMVDMVDMSTSSSLSPRDSSSKKESSSVREARARAKPSPVDIPVDWQPSAEGQRFAAARGHTPAEIADIVLKFRNHQQTQGTRSLDWSKSWQNWVVNERRQPARQGQSPSPDPLREARRKFAIIAGDPSLQRGSPNQGFNQCMAQ